MKRSIAATVLIICFVGCAPRARLTFPYRRLIATTQPQSFDCDGDGRNDFAVTFDHSGRLDAVALEKRGDRLRNRSLAGHIILVVRPNVA